MTRNRDWYVPDPARPEPAPAADATYFGAYGLTNPWVVWLLKRAPEMVADTARDFLRRDDRRPPACPACDARMAFRWSEWVCYRLDEHAEPVRLPIEEQLLPAPDVDVLTRVAEPLDAVLVDGRWKVRAWKGIR
ncbi:MAG TPA: hypothetical protein VFC53_04005 [Dehalococcoidia bacterium]|nr:hypothetical protein [Dehalococcoidia bacterium]